MKKRPAFRKEIVELPLRFMSQAAIHRFSLEGGKEGQWNSIYSEGETALVAPITTEGNIVLVKMFRFPVENWVFELPGGCPESEKDFANATKRELLEETGYQIDEPLEKLAQGWLYNGKTNASFIIFSALNCRKVTTPNLDPVEELAGLEVVEKNPREIMQEIAQGNPDYDPPISHALISLLQRGIIS